MGLFSGVGDFLFGQSGDPDSAQKWYQGLGAEMQGAPEGRAELLQLLRDRAQTLGGLGSKLQQDFNAQLARQTRGAAEEVARQYGGGGSQLGKARALAEASARSGEQAASGNINLERERGNLLQQAVQSQGALTGQDLAERSARANVNTTIGNALMNRANMLDQSRSGAIGQTLGGIGRIVGSSIGRNRYNGG